MISSFFNNHWFLTISIIQLNFFKHTEVKSFCLLGFLVSYGAKQLLSHHLKNLVQLVHECIIIILHKDITLSRNFQQICVKKTHLGGS